MSGFTRDTPVTDETPCFLMESIGRRYEMTHAEAQRLVEMGLLVRADESEVLYETTALVWDDMGIEGDRAFVLFDLILGRS